MQAHESQVAASAPDVSDVEVSIVMPCLNESRTLKICIDKAFSACARHGLSAEIIVADNGSTDGSADLAISCGANVVRVERKGYGSALRGGIAGARGRFVIIGDADDSYDFSDLFKFVEKLRQGHELVMGCRMPWAGGTIMPGAMPWKHRWIGNPILTAIGKIFFLSVISDFHCGMRAFRKDTFERMDLRTDGMEFASEMVVKASLKKMKMTEVPITLYKDGRDSRPPHLRSWRDGWRHLRFMLLFSPKWLFLYPGIALLILGLAASAALLRGPLWIGAIGFDTNTLLVSCMMVLIGSQLVYFAMFAKIFAISENLLPPDPKIAFFQKFFKLEVNIFLGGLLSLGGLLLLVWEVSYWEGLGYGQLSYSESLRVVIPAVSLIVLGVETVFSSFFISVLDLKRETVRS